MKKETKMGLRIVTILVVILVLVNAIMITFAVRLYSKYEMLHFFDEWKVETDNKIAIAQYGSTVYFNPLDKSQSLRLREIEGVSYVEEVYCIKNDRVYFCNEELFKGENPRRHCFSIMSVALNGEDLKVHGSLNSFGFSAGYYQQYAYTTTYEKTYNTGGLYYDGQIYLKVDERIIVYDIETDTTKEAEAIPINHYSVTVDNKKVIIEDPETNETRTITHEKMAENNLYAQKLFETLEFNKESLDTFFEGVKIEDDDIYVVCCVRNWMGDAFGIVFKYDFSSDEVSYVSHKKSGNGLVNPYSDFEVVSIE